MVAEAMGERVDLCAGVFCSIENRVLPRRFLLGQNDPKLRASSQVTVHFQGSTVAQYDGVYQRQAQPHAFNGRMAVVVQALKRGEQLALQLRRNAGARITHR